MSASDSDKPKAPADDKDAKPATVIVKAEQKLEQEASKLGKFIQNYSSFLSTFVVGLAGLIATSIWQYRQSEISSHQAESQQKVAQMQAENSWRIERAEILSKNLSVLAATGGNNVEQRYGVLLSLTRGNILDPELAVSYALELGKDNPDYMKSVLQNTSDKSYVRLANAFELTCQQKYGVTRDVPICKTDKLADRSTALGELFVDEIETTKAAGKVGPMALLNDEHMVQSAPARLAWLFGPYLTSLYDRRQWAEIQKFEAIGPGAKLVSALMLAPSKPNEFIASSEATEVNKFHDDEVKWLFEYLFGASCNGECKSKVVDVMLTSYTESNGKFDTALQALLKRPRADIAAVLSRLHTRLLACQMDAPDMDTFRERVVLPVLIDEDKKPQPDLSRVDDLLDLLALLPPPAPVDAKSAQDAKDRLASYNLFLKKLREQLKDRFDKSFTNRRAAAHTARNAPSLALKKGMFCRAAEAADSNVDMGEE